MKMKKSGLIAVTVVMLASLIAGCAGGNNADNKDSKDGKTGTGMPKEKIELTMHYKGGDDKFKEAYKDVIESKYPNVTLTAVPNLTPEMIATGNVPDLIEIDNQFNISSKLVRDGLEFDLSGLIKSHNFDLNRLDQQVMTHVKSFSGGKIYALPRSRDLYALYYNKEIFDKLGEKYPDPNKAMTWEETIALAKKLTRNVGGVQYRGLGLDDPSMILNQTPFRLADGTTDEPLFQKDPYVKRYFEMFNEILDIPGNFPGPDKTKYVLKNKHEGFAKDKNLAMYFFFNSAVSRLVEAEKEGLKWDMVPMPVWKDFPNQDAFSKGSLLAISPVSKNKDAAFEVIAYMLSDEVQIARAKKGNASILVSQEVQKALYADIPEMKNHNVSAFYVNKPNPGAPGPYSKYEGLLGVYDVSKVFPKQNKDVNTTLRDLDADAKKIIAEDKAKQKK